MPKKSGTIVIERYYSDYLVIEMHNICDLRLLSHYFTEYQISKPVEETDYDIVVRLQNRECYKYETHGAIYTSTLEEFIENAKS